MVIYLLLTVLTLKLTIAGEINRYPLSNHNKRQKNTTTRIVVRLLNWASHKPILVQTTAAYFQQKIAKFCDTSFSYCISTPGMLKSSPPVVTTGCNGYEEKAIVFMDFVFNISCPTILEISPAILNNTVWAKKSDMKLLPEIFKRNKHEKWKSIK